VAPPDDAPDTSPGTPPPAPHFPTNHLANVIALKHGLDRILATAGLVVLSPLLAGIAVWVRAESGRPVLLRQRRAGKDGKPFGMLKFRTMVPDAIEVGRRIGIGADPYGMVPNDPRITRSGRFLRRTSLDELPQLWNVLRGEMSLVGPRPDLVEQAAHYTPEERRRLTVRPGITGWSQIQGRDEIPWPERFEHDAWYVEHWSLVLDAKILLRTFSHLFRPEPTPVEDTMNIERARAKSRKPERSGELE
jgi:lipopolysaccharide/colanic/teichoic acid biosynthesis glycosyltransferase